MQPPGGGPPGDKRHPLPPPWGQPGAPAQQPHQHGYPPQQPPQQGYPPQQPPQHGYPPQQPQHGYPPQPPQQGYPPQQPPQHGYPPQQPQHGYPPQQPQHGYPPQPQPHGYPQQPPPQGYPQPQQPQHGYPPQPPPHGHAPHPGALPLSPPPADLPQAYVAGSYAPPAPPGDGFVGFLKLSLRRALRVRIEPSEVLPQERAALAQAQIADPAFQAFLAWRRSVLFVVACALIPLVILRFIEIADLGGQNLPDGLVALNALPAVAEAAFLAIAWAQLRNWTRWQRQRRTLAIGWAIFFLTPFVIFLYPMQLFFDGMIEKAQLFLVGMVVAIQAMMTLIPKAISLVPGMMRAALVTKLLFPGTSAPGWLLVLCAPVYAVLVYVALLMPFQITGSGYFILAMAGVIGAQVILGRAGFRLARPQTIEDAIATVRATRASYLLAMTIGAFFVVVAFWRLIESMEIGVLSVINLVLAFLTSVLMLTLITTDVVIASLDRARGITAGTGALAEDAQRQIAAFVAAAGGGAVSPGAPAGPPGPPPMAPPGPPPA